MAVPTKQAKSGAPRAPTAGGKPGEAGALMGVQQAMQRLNEVSSRLRLTEERIDNNRQRLRVFDDDLVDSKKKFAKNFKGLDEEIDRSIEILGRMQDIEKRRVEYMQKMRRVEEERITYIS